jgi:hypothetical protein
MQYHYCALEWRAVGTTLIVDCEAPLSCNIRGIARCEEADVFRGLDVVGTSLGGDEEVAASTHVDS